MSTGANLALVIGSMAAIAVAFILLTRRSGESGTPTEPTVVWLRPIDWRVQHAFWAAELRVELAEASALGHCGTWLVVELRPDDYAERCSVCERAVARMEEHRHR